ncbi:Glycine dehydrogenase [Erysiphe neolycopersici]|uniref:Glycine dehydrogenase n=1 Tax=Erysiphe neolycopersici TaxID=212602 RepID=A0A420HK73_9PEZI|nr:Glycine dehydrogenase [Erysiphe neolycopersici]
MKSINVKFLDRLGVKALRPSFQTREQHIHREKATGSLCTAQALLANMSAFYAIYHGPNGLRDTAQKVIIEARVLEGLRTFGFETGTRGLDENKRLFIKVPGKARKVLEIASSIHNINLSLFDEDRVGVTIDETTKATDIEDILSVFNNYLDKKLTHNIKVDFLLENINKSKSLKIRSKHKRVISILSHPVFNAYHSETELLR